MRYRINTPRVIHQTFETEVVVVDLQTGTYYSLRESAVPLWHGIESGGGVEELSALFQSPNVAEVTSFLDRLAEEELIVPEDGIIESAVPIEARSKELFVRPVLEKYTEMREMLLIDPIHELDESGWPRRGPQPNQR